MASEKSTTVPPKARSFTAPKAGKAKAVKNFYIKRARREASRKLKS
jgi:hypothetical protein